jgi:hypothetical protein
LSADGHWLRTERGAAMRPPASTPADDS